MKLEDHFKGFSFSLFDLVNGNAFVGLFSLVTGKT